MDLHELMEKTRNHAEAKKELEAIQARNEDGLLVPEEVVRRAEKEDSALHPFFDWDDTVAGHQWRLSQARGLIREIQVFYADDGRERKVPRYVSLGIDRSREGGGYRETKAVLNSKELLRELELTARRELESWTKRYQMLSDLCDKVSKAAGIGGKKKKT